MAVDLHPFLNQEDTVRRPTSRRKWIIVASIALLLLLFVSFRFFSRNRTLHGNQDWILSVSFSPDGRILASGGIDGSIELWDVANGRLLSTLKGTLEGHDGVVYSVAFSPDGHTLASGSSDRTIRLWDLTNGSVLLTLEGTNDYTEAMVAFSPDGRTLAWVGVDGNIKLSDVASGELLRTLPGAISIAFSPDGRTLATGGSSIELWDVSSGKLLRAINGVGLSIRSVAFSRDGHTLTSWYGHPYVYFNHLQEKDRFLYKAEITLWDVNNGRQLHEADTEPFVYGLAFSTNGSTLASGEGDGTIKLYDVASGNLLRTLEGHKGTVYSVAFSPDGRTLASGSADKTIRLWDISYIRNY